MIRVTVTSLAGSILAAPRLQPTDSLQRLIDIALAAVQHQGALKIKLVHRRGILEPGLTVAEARLQDEDVLTAIVVSRFEFGRFSEANAALDKQANRFERRNAQAHFSVAIGKFGFERGCHTWAFRKASGHGTGCTLGICAADMPLDFHPVVGAARAGYCAFYRTSVKGQGSLMVASSTLGRSVPQATGLPSLQKPGATLEMTLDCDARELRFRVEAEEQACIQASAITDLPDVPLHVFLGIDDIGDAWEVVE